PLTITASNASRVYGAADPSFTVNYSGFVLRQNSSVLGGTLSIGTTTTPSSNVGTHLGAIVPGGLTSTNYSITFVAGDLTITPATLTYVANSASSVYGSAIATLSGTVTGFVNGEDMSVTSGTLTFTTNATSSSNVGTYFIDASGLTATNYVFV